MSVIEQRVRQLKKRFVKDPHYHEDYNMFMEAVITKGCAEMVPDEELVGEVDSRVKGQSLGKLQFGPRHETPRSLCRDWNITVLFEVAFQQAHPVLFDSDRAFRDTIDLASPYLRNCRFPRHMIEYLRLTNKLPRECSLGAQVSSALQLDRLRPVSEQFISRFRVNSTRQSFEIIDICVGVLLSLVDSCIHRFGEHSVLYEGGEKAV
ncbi:uncharacterized protein LOC102807426 [Saccoglossus kowalevskii]|uniref:Uncharacterized protein LOC102807426 n=1 Tax=Saccoglossus kowalevskii TaxID=10224 RepID=A0ABM0LZI4_SACKO|nr:PREDICTED: uncharacterized protein LOC102807426 [Saccoglossus kowalevskii]